MMTVLALHVIHYCFNEFDPNEDTESLDLAVPGGKRCRFNEFDPNEDTESIDHRQQLVVLNEFQ